VKGEVDVEDMRYMYKELAAALHIFSRGLQMAMKIILECTRD
jgi:hypothetical protein